MVCYDNLLAGIRFHTEVNAGQGKSGFRGNQVSGARVRPFENKPKLLRVLRGRGDDFRI